MTASLTDERCELHSLVERAKAALAYCDAERDLYVREGKDVPAFVVKRRQQLTSLIAEMSMAADDPTAATYKLRRSIAVLSNALAYGVPSPRAPRPLSLTKTTP
ncbi:hypothetical protein [Tsukamurella pseudospumae]|uniref:Uncharacterized protein n=1 Tax=Tsukamurella pseudospumae TaxID=239498 RepID=A0A138AW69_9ACTN|nr:hypothetical protein [Tsukamurella pseudospumae]KXP14698.1 hypothetical protein AXK60_02070 [Tsukamurella pseudospumae]